MPIAGWKGLMKMMNMQEQNTIVELTDNELAQISGATQVNFDLSSYLFVVGAGVVFNDGITKNVVNIAFDTNLKPEQ